MTDPFPAFTLAAGRSRAEVVPGRGGLVTRFVVGGIPLLYLDEETLRDPARNVRGGIPVLFPAAGRLSGDRFSRGGAGHQMMQHGFARSLPWSVTEERPNRIAMSLGASEATRSAFPFDFRLDFTVSLSEAALRIDQRYANRSAEPMPLHAGFHPYFFVPDSEKGRASVETAATRAFDNVAKADIAFHGLDLTAREVDLHLHDHGGCRSAVRRPGLRRPVEIVASPEFGHWVIWTLAGRDFVCVEPWTAPADALNTGERLLWVPAGSAQTLFIEIRLGDPAA